MHYWHVNTRPARAVVMPGKTGCIVCFVMYGTPCGCSGRRRSGPWGDRHAGAWDWGDYCDVPGLDPIGPRMAVVTPRFPSPEPHWMKVVGVVAAVRHEGLDRAPRPQYCVPYLRGEWRSPYLVVRAAGDPIGISPALRRTVAAVDGNAVVTDLVPLDSLVSASSAPLRFRARLLGAFAILALLLAAAGTCGVMSCVVEQRTAEIGVRMTLGADAGDIFAMVLGEGPRWRARDLRSASSEGSCCGGSWRPCCSKPQPPTRSRLPPQRHCCCWRRWARAGAVPARGAFGIRWRPCGRSAERIGSCPSATSRLANSQLSFVT